MTRSDLLLETIRCKKGLAEDLHYHQQRVDESRKALFGLSDKLDLASSINPPDQKLYRCRVLYAQTIESIEYIPYLPREIHTLKMVPITFSYDYKFADRSDLDALLEKHPDADDVIMVKDGLITDTTIANIAFFDGERWITPKHPLLKGTMRAKLIEQGFLHERDIESNEVKTFEKVALMNAMIGFNILKHIKIT